MLFTTPELTEEEIWVVARITDLRERLRYQVAQPRRWLGLLRRISLARNIQGSNSIEGYNVTLDDAVALADREAPLDANEETLAAVEGYREAMTYVLQLADDPQFEWTESLVKSLHYMMLSYDLDKSPGRWRLGTIYVRREETGEIVYEGPDAAEVPGLMSAVIERLRTNDGDELIRAAMAHLNLVMVHPFRDGNGRMARCLQTLVLARTGILVPEFSSIEEYLGRNTEEYYSVLSEVGAGRWHPEGDARPWVRFCLVAQYRQAQTLLRRVRESEDRWAAIERMAGGLAIAERALPTLFDASMGFRIRNASYRTHADVSELVASRDLRALVDAGLLEPRGERRGRFYVRSARLATVDADVRGSRSSRSFEDPFELARDAIRRPTLGLIH